MEFVTALAAVPTGGGGAPAAAPRINQRPAAPTPRPATPVARPAPISRPAASARKGSWTTAGIMAVVTAILAGLVMYLFMEDQHQQPWGGDQATMAAALAGALPIAEGGRGPADTICASAAPHTNARATIQCVGEDVIYLFNDYGEQSARDVFVNQDALEGWSSGGCQLVSSTVDEDTYLILPTTAKGRFGIVVAGPGADTARTKVNVC